MKKLLLASSTLVFAGDPRWPPICRPVFPAKAPVVAPVAYSWTGCYLGGHVGAGWSRTGYSEPNGAFPVLGPPGYGFTTKGDAAVLGGVQAGCDYQFAGNWVIGIGGDFSWTDIKDSGIDPFFGGKTALPSC